MLSVLVVVGAVKGMSVSIMDVVNMVAVLNSLMTTVFTMGVFFDAVFSNGAVLIVVVTMKGVVVLAVDVVDVVTVLDCFVSTVFAVLVLSDGVFCVLIGHGVLLRQVMANEESIPRSVRYCNFFTLLDVGIILLIKSALPGVHGG